MRVAFQIAHICAVTHRRIESSNMLTEGARALGFARQAHSAGYQREEPVLRVRSVSPPSMHPPQPCPSTQPILNPIH
jgi:hypothetical protein